MDDEQFNELELKVLGGEATESEKVRLRDQSESDPQREREFKELQAVWMTVKEVFPLTQAAQEAPAVELPAHTLNRLRQEVAKKFAPNAVSAGTPPLGTRSEFSLRLLSERLGKVWSGLRLGYVRVLVILVLVAGIGIGVKWLQSPPRPVALDQTVAAFLVPTRGEAEVWRSGKVLSTAPASKLLAADKVLLGTDAQASLVTELGETEIRGPGDFVVGEIIRGMVTNVSGIESSTQVGTNKTLLVALFSPPHSLPNSGLLVMTRDRRPIHLYCPLGSTSEHMPVFRWKADPGKKYDLDVLDEMDPKSVLARVRGVVPPVEFSQVASPQGKVLTRGGLYRVSVRETGNPLSESEYTFNTVDRPGISSNVTPGARVLRAYQIIANDPARAGDALEELMSLPSTWEESELALRLKTLIFGVEGYQEEFDAACTKLQADREPVH